MKLDEILDMIAADSVVDKAALDSESLRIPYLHSKYYRILVDELRALRAIELEYKLKKKERTDYYLGKADDEVYKEEPLDFKVMKADLDLYLDADPKLVPIQGRLAQQKIKVDVLEKFISQISNRSFNIRNAIEFLKFKNGLV